MPEYKSYDDLHRLINARWKEIENPKWDDMRVLARELRVSFSEVWEALGYADYFDFVEDDT